VFGRMRGSAPWDLDARQASVPSGSAGKLALSGLCTAGAGYALGESYDRLLAGSDKHRSTCPSRRESGAFYGSFLEASFLAIARSVDLQVRAKVPNLQ
jgi:hypothetical protein